MIDSDWQADDHLSGTPYQALDQSLTREQEARDRREKLRRVMALAAEIREALTVGGKLPPLGHRILCDEATGLPV